MHKMDPSGTLGFYCHNHEEYEDFVFIATEASVARFCRHFVALNETFLIILDSVQILCGLPTLHVLRTAVVGLRKGRAGFEGI